TRGNAPRPEAFTKSTAGSTACPIGMTRGEPGSLTPSNAKKRWRAKRPRSPGSRASRSTPIASRTLPPKEQRLQPGTRFQHRPGKPQSLLLPVADRPHDPTTGGSRQFAAQLGGRVRTDTLAIVRQPEESRPPLAGCLPLHGLERPSLRPPARRQHSNPPR